MQRLHRGRHALGREARQLGVAQRLDVLDPVRRDGVPAGRAVGVERRRDGAVADRVRRALEAGAREPRDDLRVAPGVGPERLRALAVRSGLEQPRGPGVDHAVDEELRHPGAPAPPAAVALREQRLDLVVGRVRLEQHAARRSAASGRRAPRAPPRRRSSHGMPSITCPPVRPSAFSRRSVAAYASSRCARVRSGTSSRTSSIAGASRSSPVGTPPSSHTTAEPAENSRAPSTPAQRERRPARERRVVVEERQVRRRVARRVGDRVGADRPAVERVVAEAPAEQPLARARSAPARRRARRAPRRACAAR